MPNVLTAEREGPHVKLTMSFPDGFDHCFVVERLIGPNPAGEQVWESIHTGVNKFVKGGVDWELARPPDDPDAEYLPLAGPRTYRALAYRMHTEPNILHTEGVFTDPVTVQ